MNNKCLRIIIVETQHLEQFFIEKVLNSLGYYCIAPMASLAEAKIAIRYAVLPFDLLIINSDQECCDDVDLHAYCQSSEKLRHSIIYGGNVEPPLPQSFHRSSDVHMRVNHRLDVTMLKKIMKLVDPSTQCPARKSPAAR